MALTSVLKPSGFRPVGTGKLLYTFTEASIAGKPNYHVEIQLNGYTATLPIFRYSPNSSLEISVDLAPILRSLLLMSVTASDRFKSTYVKYQAVWDGGSDAQVNLSSDVIYFYVGSNNLLNKRTKFYIDSTGGNFLADEINAVIGRSLYVDFIHDASLSSSSMLRYNGKNGIGSSFVSFAGNSIEFETRTTIPTDDLESIDIRSYVNSTDWATSLAGATAWPLSAVAQAYGQKFTTPGTAGKMLLRIPIFRNGTPDYTIIFKIVGDSAGLPNEADVKSSVTIKGGVWGSISTDYLNPTYLNIDFNDFSLAGSTVYHFLILYQNDYTYDPYSNYLNIFRPGGNPYAGGEYESKAGGVWIGSGMGNDITATMYFSSTIYATIPVNMIEECKNPLYLKWINNYGGISTWLFSGDQVFEIDPTDDGQFKRMTCVARGLTMDQWLMLEELNKKGVEYGDNKKLGAEVVDFTDESNPIEIFVEDNRDSTQTKKYTHEITLTLRYPLIDNIEIS